MLTLRNGQPVIRCDRRDFLRVGGLAAAGLALPDRWPQAARGANLASVTPGATKVGAAKSCVLIYLLGGPPHQDMFDLKPAAPAEIRGPFAPIATRVPGLQICEHLPRLAQAADQYALVRSVSHENHNHTPMIYYTLTGRNTDQPSVDNDVRPPLRSDFPHTGAVVSRFKPSPAALPGFIALPELAVRSSLGSEFKRARLPLRGGGGGFLGPAFDALNVNGPPGSNEAIPAIGLPAGIDADRFERRTELLRLLSGPSARGGATASALRDSAIALTGAASRGRLETFSLDGETPATHERYGTHRFGQSLLLARRLVEAEVPLIAVHWNEMTVCDGWDTHSRNFVDLERELLPMLDQGLSALLEDLKERGLLGQTVVACFGEFGRTPRINGNAGRDHWGSCSTALLAGGGIRGGQVYGASDKIAAWPSSNPVDPVDIQATLYKCLGLDPHRTQMHDPLGRALPISLGTPIDGLF